MKEKQESHEKLPYKQIEYLENIIFEFTKKLDKIKVADEVSHSKHDQIKKLNVKKT